MSVRSPSGVSGSLTVWRPFDTGRLSPVSADSPTSSVAASSTRPSAGTTSPASTCTTSPGTSCSAGSSTRPPSRRTFALIIIIFTPAAPARAAYPSGRGPTTVWKGVRKWTPRPVRSSWRAQVLPIPATRRTICIGSSYWRTNARQRGSVAVTVNLFGPYCARRAAASALARPRTASTSSPLVTCSGARVYHCSSGRSRCAGASTVVAIVLHSPFRADAPPCRVEAINRPRSGPRRPHPERMIGLPLRCGRRSSGGSTSRSGRMRPARLEAAVMSPRARTRGRGRLGRSRELEAGRVERDDGPRLAAEERGRVVDGADRGEAAGLLDEGARRLHLRPHRPLGKRRGPERFGGRPADAPLVRRAPVGVDRVDVRDDQQRVGVEVRGEEGARHVLVDHRLDADEAPAGRDGVVLVHDRDAAAAGADDDRAFLEQPLDGLEPEDPLRLGGGDDSPEGGSVRLERPALCVRDLGRFPLLVDR